MSDYVIQFADWCEFPPETMAGETVFDGEGNAIGWIVNATVERSCASCPEMDNPDSYISHLQSALRWHDEHVPRPTNPRNTCVVLQGEKPPEEVLFVREDGVTHYLPEDAVTCKRVYHPNRITKTCTCSNCGYGASDERWAYCPKCGHKYVHGEVEERWKRAGRKVAE